MVRSGRSKGLHTDVAISISISVNPITSEVSLNLYTPNLYVYMESGVIGLKDTACLSVLFSIRQN